MSVRLLFPFHTMLAFALAISSSSPSNTFANPLKMHCERVFVEISENRKISRNIYYMRAEFIGESTAGVFYLHPEDMTYHLMSHSSSGKYDFVLNPANEIISVYEQGAPGLHHSSLLAGKPVGSAGQVELGEFPEIRRINNYTGHYPVDSVGLLQGISTFLQAGYEVPNEMGFVFQESSFWGVKTKIHSLRRKGKNLSWSMSTIMLGYVPVETLNSIAQQVQKVAESYGHDLEYHPLLVTPPN